MVSLPPTLSDDQPTQHDTSAVTIAAQAARLEELTWQLEAIKAIKGTEHNNGKVTADGECNTK
jgi:protein-disulfide isomerase-like protein with CxxC motif